MSLKGFQMIKINSEVSIEIHNDFKNTCTFVTQEYDMALRDWANSWIVNIENPNFSLEIKFSNEIEAQTFCKNLILLGLQA